MRYGFTLVALALTLGPGVALANLISNGDFEAGTTNWTLSGHVGVVGAQGAPLWYGGGSATQNGARVAVFNQGDRTPGGSFAQSFGTIAGHTYTVQFDYGVTGVFQSDTQQIALSVLGANSSNLLSQTVTGSNPPIQLGTFTFSFLADGPTATLLFADLTGNSTRSRDGILDNVLVTAVPEPAILSLMGLALAAIAFARGAGRKRHR